VYAGRVLLVEDEASISEPLAELLRLEGFEATVATTAAEGLALAERADPDIVLLDLMLPDGNGRDVCRTIRTRSTVPIFMITARGAVHDRLIGLELGADDYIAKPFDGDEVIARIRAILRRTQRQPEAQRAGRLTCADLEIDTDARRVWRAGRELQLSRKEYDLLEMLARHMGQVVRREDLMSEVWDVNWFGSTRTLDVHVGSVRHKLGEDGAGGRLIHTVRGVGFRLCPPEGPP
jgi:two-component system, OmpR family, response regulator RegX3